MISKSGRRIIGTGTMLAALTGGLALTAGTANAAPAAPAATTPAATAPAPKVQPLTLAPSCVTFTQYKHGNAFTGYYTNVYLDNRCNGPQRVKVVMTHGFDSPCIQLPKDKIDYFFRSNSDDGSQPFLTRIDAC